jgi:hypothetical protein
MSGRGGKWTATMSWLRRLDGELRRQARQPCSENLGFVWVTKTPSDSRVEKLGGIFREDGGAAFRPLWVAEDVTAGPVRQQAPYSMGGCARRQRRAGSVHEITMAPFP